MLLAVSVGGGLQRPPAVCVPLTGETHGKEPWLQAASWCCRKEVAPVASLTTLGWGRSPFCEAPLVVFKRKRSRTFSSVKWWQNGGEGRTPFRVLAWASGERGAIPGGTTAGHRCGGPRGSTPVLDLSTLCSGTELPAAPSGDHPAQPRPTVEGGSGNPLQTRPRYLSLLWGLQPPLEPFSL